MYFFCISFCTFSPFFTAQVLPTKMRHGRIPARPFFWLARFSAEFDMNKTRLFCYLMVVMIKQLCISLHTILRAFKVQKQKMHFMPRHAHRFSLQNIASLSVAQRTTHNWKKSFELIWNYATLHHEICVSPKNSERLRARKKRRFVWHVQGCRGCISKTLTSSHPTSSIGRVEEMS